MKIPKKILLVQFYSNGDCLYVTTIAKQIKKDFKDCHLTWAIADYCKEIIKNNPYIDSILEVKDIPKNDTVKYRKIKKQFIEYQKKGIYDEVFFTQNMDDNLALYDGCIRSSLFNAYPNSITVDLTPVVVLDDDEIKKAKKLAEEVLLSQYKHVILFEFAPQSGQANLSIEDALRIAERLTNQPDTAVIMSSAYKINHSNPQIIDGSILKIRETAALMQYCTFLLGTSSGITWLSTSSAGKKLPMIQILNPDTVWLNSISRDFERFNIPNEGVIELTDFKIDTIVSATTLALSNFAHAKHLYHNPIKVHFRTSRIIVYNLLCYLHFHAILKHIALNRRVYGDNIQFYKQVGLGILDLPFKLVKNLWKKKLSNFSSKLKSVGN